MRVTILDAVEALPHMPNCQHVKALAGHVYGYRLRVGNYRVLFATGTGRYESWNSGSEKKG
ncbi:mRNA-degrading endonuclease RelE of RelBE toxin-antitoxin system [Cupriavidus necator]|nr:mRNA-degrading endonuclease RelE of RelBE toxin-antitoxin system [Cupriavidus necator]